MTALKESVGAGDELDLSAYWLLDDFDREGPDVGNGWLDASTIYPDQFDTPWIENDDPDYGTFLNCTGFADDTWASPPGTSPFLVGHTLLVGRIPTVDNFQVGITWDARDWQNYKSQISPVAFVDVEANKLELGVKPVFDVGLSGTPTYFQNEFRSDTLEDALDPPDYYRPIENTEGSIHNPGGFKIGSNHVNISGTPQSFHSFVIRVRNGLMNAWWDGHRIGRNHWPVPSYCLDGRPNYVGLSVIPINYKVGYELLPGSPITEMAKDKIKSVYACQFTGSLDQ